MVDTRNLIGTSPKHHHPILCRLFTTSVPLTSQRSGKGSKELEEIAQKTLDIDKNPIKYATHEPGKFTLEPHDKPYMELTLRNGKHSELVQRLLRQRIENRAKEFPRWPSEQACGVRTMWIESRFWYDRERLSPDFDDDWRKYRARYLHSLELDPREPVHVPEYERSLIHPMRRFTMKGGDIVESFFSKVLGYDKYHSAAWRVVVTRSFMAYLGCIGFYYMLRYTYSKWDTKDGPVLMASQPVVYPGDPRWPYVDPKKLPTDHDSSGFADRTIFRDLRDFEDQTAVI